MELGCDRVVFVPSGNPPHKRCTADFSDREAMLRLAAAELPNTVVDTSEGEDGEVHYSKDMLPRLTEKYGDCVFVIGGDSLIDMDKWRDPDKVIAAAPILAFPRKDRDGEFARALAYWRSRGARIHADGFTPDGVSSTAARYLAEMRDYSLIAPSVARYIADRGCTASTLLLRTSWLRRWRKRRTNTSNAPSSALSGSTSNAHWGLTATRSFWRRCSTIAQRRYAVCLTIPLLRRRTA